MEGVAQGRNLDPATVLAAAEGRVWTGEQAVAQGLVDDLGGFAGALRRVREAVGVEADQAIRLRPFPQQPGPLDQLLDLLSDPSRLVGVLRPELPAWPGVLSSPRLTMR
jgi:protease-4